MTKSKNGKTNTAPAESYEYINRMVELVPLVPESYEFEMCETSHLYPSLTVPDDCYTITEMLSNHVPTMYADSNELYFDAKSDDDISEDGIDFDADIAELKHQVDGLRAQEFIKQQQIAEDERRQRQAQYDADVIARYQQLQNEKK